MGRERAPEEFVIPNPEEGRPAEECPHESVRELGADGGGNAYRQCADCMSVLVGTDAEPADGAERRPAADDDGPDHPLVQGLTLERDPHAPNRRPPTRSLRKRLKGLWRRLRQ